MTLIDILPLTRNLIVVDCEATGPNPIQDRIVEIGFIQVKPDGTTREWQSLVNPGVSIPAEATRVHGIDDARIQRCVACDCYNDDVAPDDRCRCECFKPVPTFAQLAPHLLRGFVNCDFAGYNHKSYDLPLIAAEFERAGHTWSYADAKILDGYRIWQLKEGRSLTDASKHFLHTTPEKTHRVLDDVRISVEVLAAQLRAFQDLPRDVARLHALQWPIDPNAIDAGGKFVWQHGVAVLNFGKKHKGKALHLVPRDYLQWMLGAEFPIDAKRIAQDALEGRLPVQKV